MHDNELAPIIDAVAARLLDKYIHSYMLWLIVAFLPPD